MPRPDDVDDRPRLEVTGPVQHVTSVENDIGEQLLFTLARTARRHDVMISLTVTPFYPESNDEPDDVALGGSSRA